MAKKQNEIAVSPFVILSDTREQNPWNFQNIRQLKKDGGLPVAVQIQKYAMTTGDYSIKGFENIIAVERKSKEDFFQCCIHDRERFEKQLTRLNELDHPYLVIECSEHSIMQGLDGSAVNPVAIMQSIIAWQQELCPKVRWWFAYSRNTAENWVYRIFERYWRNYL